MTGKCADRVCGGVVVDVDVSNHVGFSRRLRELLSPYAVFEGDDILVIKSEGDYFFALKFESTNTRWLPLPMESDRPEDVRRLRLVVARLREAVRVSAAPEVLGVDWKPTDDYDTLWGMAQRLSSTLPH